LRKYLYKKYCIKNGNEWQNKKGSRPFYMI